MEKKHTIFYHIKNIISFIFWGSLFALVLVFIFNYPTKDKQGTPTPTAPDTQPGMTAAEAAEAGIEHMNTIDYTTGPDAWLAGLKEVSTSYGTSFEKNKEKGLYNWKNIYIPQKVVASIEYEAVEVVHDAPLWLKNSTSQKPEIGRAHV